MEIIPLIITTKIYQHSKKIHLSTVTVQFVFLMFMDLRYQTKFHANTSF